MDELRGTSLLFPWYMLFGILVASSLADTTLLSWETVAQTDEFAILSLVFYAIGLALTCLNWMADRRYRISTLSLIGLMVFVSIAIASPPLAIISGLILMSLDIQSRKQNRKQISPTLFWTQRCAIFCGVVYVTANSIQHIRSVVANAG